MNKENKFMINEKIGLIYVIVLVCAILFMACDNLSEPPEIHTPIESGYGKITINLFNDEIVSQQARTVFPSLIYDKYVYTFTRAGYPIGIEKNPNNEGFFFLETGIYTVEVKAYIGDEEPYTLAASGVSSEFTVSSGNNAPVTILLSRVGSNALGEFTYTITFPWSSETISITLLKWPDYSGGLDMITLTPNDFGNGVTQTLQLETGSYLFTVLIENGSLNAGISEAVHIGMTPTVYTKTFENKDFHASIP